MESKLHAPHKRQPVFWLGNRWRREFFPSRNIKNLRKGVCGGHLQEDLLGPEKKVPAGKWPIFLDSNSIHPSTREVKVPLSIYQVVICLEVLFLIIKYCTGPLCVVEKDKKKRILVQWGIPKYFDAWRPSAAISRNFSQCLTAVYPKAVQTDRMTPQPSNGTSQKKCNVSWKTEDNPISDG